MTRSQFSYIKRPDPIIATARENDAARLERDRATLEALTQGIEETVKLDEARGQTYIHPQQRRGEAPKPKRRLDGLGFLLWKNRLTAQQYEAGRKYESFFVILETGDVRSCLASMEVRAPSNALTPGQAKIYARHKLAEARSAVSNHTGMVLALDQVCGIGLKPTDVCKTRRDYERIEDHLDCALTMLAKHWGMT